MAFQIYILAIATITFLLIISARFKKEGNIKDCTFTSCYENKQNMLNAVIKSSNCEENTQEFLNQRGIEINEFGELTMIAGKDHFCTQQIPSIRKYDYRYIIPGTLFVFYLITLCIVEVCYSYSTTLIVSNYNAKRAINEIIFSLFVTSGAIIGLL